MNEEFVSASRAQAYLGLSNAYTFLRIAVEHQIRTQRLPGKSTRYSMTDISRVARQLEAERRDYTAA